jgi:hypothetical protein
MPRSELRRLSAYRLCITSSPPSAVRQPLQAVLPGSPFRIRGEFAAVGFGTPTPLALRFAADRLTGLKLGWLEDPLAIATPPLDHTGVVALKGQAKNLEAFIESVPRPRRWLSPATNPVEMRPFYSGADTQPVQSSEPPPSARYPSFQSSVRPDFAKD